MEDKQKDEPVKTSSSESDSQPDKDERKKPVQPNQGRTFAQRGVEKRG